MENWDLTTSKSRQRYVHFFAIQHLFSTLSFLLFLGGEVAWNALNKNKNDFCRIPLLEEEPCLPHHVATETWGSYTHAHPWIQNTNTSIHKYKFPIVMRIYSKRIVPLYLFVNAWSSCDIDGPTIAASGSPILQASRGNDGALPDGWAPSGKVPNFVVSQNVKREHHWGSIGKKLKPFSQLDLIWSLCKYIPVCVLVCLHH